MLVLQDRHSAILCAHVVVVDHNRLSESQVLQDIRLQGGQLLHASAALKLKHRENLLVTTRDRRLLVSVRGAHAEDARPVGILQQLILQPHLAGLGEGPHLAIVCEGSDRVGILARRQDGESGLCRDFLETPLHEKITKAGNEFVVRLGILHGFFYSRG